MPLDGLLTRLNGIAPMLTGLSAGGPVRLGCQRIARPWGRHCHSGQGAAHHATSTGGLRKLAVARHGKLENGSGCGAHGPQSIDELSLKDGGGSSAMPHKQNPVLAELLVTLAHFNATQVSAVHQALVHEQERSGAAWSLEWMILPQMVRATGCALTASRTARQHDRIGSS